MIPFLVNGLVIGCIYGVVACGVVVVYKGSRAINFAHGETGMLAAFVVWELWAQGPLPFAGAAVIGVAVAGSIGWLTERLVIRRFPPGSTLPILIATLAVAGLIQFVAVERWGGDPVYLDSPFRQPNLVFGQVVLTAPRLAAIGTTVVVVVALWVWFGRSRFGLTFRAAAIDAEAAALSGVDVGRTSSFTWTLGAVLSGVAAIAVAPLVSLHVLFMTLLFLRALAAVLIAGPTSFVGAFAVALGIGVTESLLARATGRIGMAEVALLGLILVALLVRPRGVVGAEY